MLSIDFLYPFLLIVHVFICIFLILLVLVQSDKGGGLAGALGGMSSGAAFSGSSAATIITKMTQGTAILGFVVILLLNALSVKRTGPASGQAELEPKRALSNVIPEGYTPPGEGVPGLQTAPATSQSKQSVPGLPAAQAEELPPSDAETSEPPSEQE